MFYLLLIVFLCAVWGIAKKAQKEKTENDYCPVTIIKDGKSVTINGYDRELLKRELTKATAKTKQNTIDKDEIDSNKLSVAITGKLSLPRNDMIIRINSTKNARFVERVASNTDYLVAARDDTAKARAARANGTTIISEEQLMEYLQKGEFPRGEHKTRKYHANTFAEEIAWQDTFDPPVEHHLEYVDSVGEYSERTIAVLHLCGKHPNSGYEYMEAYEDGQLKTFRRDRILKLEPVS
jgi:hypothetical protein